MIQKRVLKLAKKTIKVGGCEEYSDSFFGLFGDYPISITKEDGSDLFENAEEEYEAAHYIVTEDAIDSTEEACEAEDKDEDEDKDKDEKKPRDNTS